MNPPRKASTYCSHAAQTRPEARGLSAFKVLWHGPDLSVTRPTAVSEPYIVDVELIKQPETPAAREFL